MRASVALAQTLAFDCLPWPEEHAFLDGSRAKRVGPNCLQPSLAKMFHRFLRCSFGASSALKIIAKPAKPLWHFLASVRKVEAQMILTVWVQHPLSQRGRADTQCCCVSPAHLQNRCENCPEATKHKLQPFTQVHPRVTQISCGCDLPRGSSAGIMSPN